MACIDIIVVVVLAGLCLYPLALIAATFALSAVLGP